MYVLSSSLLARLARPPLERLAVPLALQRKRGNKALDFGGLGGRLFAFLGGEFSPDDEFADIVVFREVL